MDRTSRGVAGVRARRRIASDALRACVQGVLCLAVLGGGGGRDAFAAAANDSSSAPAVREHQSTDSIAAAARDFLRERHGDDPSLDIGGGALDARLRLGHCDAPLDARLAPGSRDVGRVTVQVRCPSTPSWRVHVALEVSRERTLWTLARGVRRGETLERDMFSRETVTLGRGESLAARAGAPVDSLDAWLGHEFARDARAGQPLVTSMIAPRRLVERGATVRIRAAGAGLAIETTGTALTDAALDERVTVRNAMSGRLIEAVATGRGVVEIIRGRPAGQRKHGERGR